jgi:hypothetical protein
MLFIAVLILVYIILPNFLLHCNAVTTANLLPYRYHHLYSVSIRNLSAWLQASAVLLAEW